MMQRCPLPEDVVNDTDSIPREAVDENVGETYWSVVSLDELPDDLADLVAPPVVVGAAPRGALS
jgi:hypothetical protein